MNESFLFNGTWYFLQNLDFYKSTVELVKSNQNRVSGYQEGQFLDFSSIKSITEEHLLFEQKVEWNNYSYFLFHFWGEWCNPCIKEIPELKEFERQLAMKNKIQLIHCPFVYKKALLDRTILAIKEHDLSKAQSLCMPGDCEPEIQDIESCNLSQYFRVNIFPQYILVNKEGKILYRGDLSKKGENILKQRIENLGI
jgi:thiol-disulfide isomerase/thioredoxin